MGRRRKKNNSDFIFNIDSLMDIVTNIVGMLIIIGIISSLSLRTKEFVFQTPMVYDTPKKSVIFECRNGEVFPVTIDQDRYYLRTFAAFQEVLLPKPGVEGESITQIRQLNSKYNHILKSIDPKKQFIFFIVRSDSYEIFREARKLAWEKNLDVGWTPKPKDEMILFSPFGEETKIVD
jgi:hypothetical protein